jgi:hypothetical protein
MRLGAVVPLPQQGVLQPTAIRNIGAQAFLEKQRKHKAEFIKPKANKGMSDQWSFNLC